MVKQILLGVAVVRSKVLFDKGLQTLWLGGTAGKVKLVQGLDDPSIDGESFGEAVGKQQDAIGDLGSNAGEALNFGAGLVVGHCPWRFEVEFTARDHLGAAEEVFGTVAHAAGAQFDLSTGGNALGGGEGFPIVTYRFTKSVAHLADDLLNLYDLFIGRTDETGEGFPWILLQKA